MSSRDWEKELAMIDKQLASLSDEELAPAAPARSAAPATVRGAAPAVTAATLGRVPAGPGIAPATVAPLGWRDRIGLLAGLGLAVGLSVGIVFWPFAARCGADLAAYLAAVLLVVLTGTWTALRSWRLRAGRSHLLALLAILWGLGLAAWQVLPRAGLALPTEARPAIWACG